MDSILIKQFEGNIWKHYYNGTDKGYIISKFYVKQDDNFGKFQIIEYGGSQRISYEIANVSVQALGGAVETNFLSDVELFQRLKELKYTGFDSSSGSSIITNISAYHGQFNWNSASNPTAIYVIPDATIVVTVHQDGRYLNYTYDYNISGNVIQILTPLQENEFITIDGLKPNI